MSDDTWTWLLGWAVAGLCILLAYRRGLSTGTRAERSRCQHLILSALDKRWSGSLRWVLHAVSNDREALLPEDEFFSAGELRKDRNEN